MARRMSTSRLRGLTVAWSFRDRFDASLRQRHARRRTIRFAQIGRGPGDRVQGHADRRPRAALARARRRAAHDRVGGQAVRVRIDGVERDPDAKNGGESGCTRSRPSSPTAPGRTSAIPGPTAAARAFRSRGARAPDGMLEPADPGIFELACTSGALGKCVRFGYRPWAFARRARAARGLQCLHPHGARGLLRQRHGDDQGRPGDRHVRRPRHSEAARTIRRWISRPAGPRRARPACATPGSRRTHARSRSLPRVRG